jgi:ParB/RepB/Spo0J family partition protein
MTDQATDTNTAQLEACRSEPAMVALLHPSPTNPRKTFPAEKLAELTESVRLHGVMQPLLVRPWPADLPWTSEVMPLHEIVAGERRYRAAVAAGLKYVPVLCRDLSDQQVLELQVIENLQREDLHELEEAEGYGLMMQRYGYTADQLAEKIGKSRSYIFGRLKLLALDEDSRRLFRGGLLNASTALLVARIPSDELRAQAVKEITETDHRGDIMSVRRAQQLIRDRYMLKLADAPFPRGDKALLPDAGRCHDCPKRTGNQPEIFADVGSQDVCTDPTCFNAKKAAHFARQVEAAASDGAEVITGEKAAKISTYGIDRFDLERAGLVDLTERCHDDPEKRTYAEILGDAAKVVMVEDVKRGVLVKTVRAENVAEVMKQAGLNSKQAAAAEKQAEAEEALRLERAWREKLLDETRKAMLNHLAGMFYALPDSPLAVTIMRKIVRRLFDRAADGDLLRKVLAIWQTEGRNFTARKERMETQIEEMPLPDLWLLAIDLLIVGGSMCSEWSMQYPPTLLLEMAKKAGVDDKYIEKSPGEATESPLAPITAAQAQEDSGAKTAAQAAEGTADETPASGKEEQDRASAVAEEGMEKPKGTSPTFAIGDRVRIIGCGMGMEQHDCLGKIGTVRDVGATLFNGQPVASITLDDGAEFTALAEEIEMYEEPTGTKYAFTSGDAEPVPVTGKRYSASPLVEYRHPDDHDLCWSGRGRKPKWVEAWLSDGGTLEEIKVSNQPARCSKTADMFEAAQS